MNAADLTLHEAAELLGVHYMTVYRSVRLGLLPAVKHGGVWQLKRADVEAYRDGTGATQSTSTGGRRNAPWAERLEARLVAGDGSGAWGVVEAALASGANLDTVYLEMVTPAMRSIGARWAAGELDVSVEHRASRIAFGLVDRLGPRFAHRGRSRGAVILGTPVGENHSLPVALVADVLRSEGWEVADLGADLPAESFVHAALHTDDLVAVGVSVMIAAHLDAAAALLAALRAALPAGVHLSIGGLAVQGHAHALELGADGWAASAREFADQLRQLHSAPVAVAAPAAPAAVAAEAPAATPA